MKIMFFNVWQGGMGDVFWNYIDSEIKNIDIFCFMEVGKEFREEFSKHAPNYDLVSVEKVVSDEGGIFQSTYVKNIYRILGSSTMLMDDSYVGMGLYTKVQDKNRILNIVNVHGVARPGEKLDNPKRLKQSEGIIEFMKDYSDSKIIGSDFNLDKNTESVKMFEKNGYRNLIEEFKIETTRNKVSWEKFKRVQLWADFIFVSPDVKVKSFEVPKNEVSDHLPLILEIEE